MLNEIFGGESWRSSWDRLGFTNAASNYDKNMEKATNEDLALTTWFVIKHLQSYNHHEEVGPPVEVEERLNKIEQP